MYKPNKKEIQQQLAAIPGKSMFAQSVRDNAMKDLDGVLLMILSQSRDNYRLVSQIIGEELLTQIENL